MSPPSARAISLCTIRCSVCAVRPLSPSASRASAALTDSPRRWSCSPPVVDAGCECERGDRCALPYRAQGEVLPPMSPERIRRQYRNGGQVVSCEVARCRGPHGRRPGAAPGPSAWKQACVKRRAIRSRRRIAISQDMVVERPSAIAPLTPSTRRRTSKSPLAPRKARVLRLWKLGTPGKRRQQRSGVHAHF